MKVSVILNGNEKFASLDNPIDISIALHEDLPSVNCFYAPNYKVEPVKEGDFIGDTQQGGIVNFKNIFINPHGNGTHTECVGHISTETYKINDCLKQFHFSGQLLTVHPTKISNGDRVIELSQIVGEIKDGIEALIVRSLPNHEDKLSRNYSGINAPYLDPQLVKFLVFIGVKHLIVDLPSVDKEQDGGKLLSHKAFWQYPEDIRTDATITELVYIPKNVKDGLYLVNIQIGNYDIDASPSKIVLFELV